MFSFRKMYMLVSRKNVFQRCFIISQGAADFHLLLLICSIRYLNCLLSGQLKINFVLFFTSKKMSDDSAAIFIEENYLLMTTVAVSGNNFKVQRG